MGKKLLELLVLGGLIAAPMRSTFSYGATLRDDMIAKAKNEGEVVIGGSHGREFTQELAGFRKKYPFLKMRGIAMRGADMAARVAAESKSGHVSMDVIDGDDAELNSLAKLGVLQKHDFPNLRDAIPDTQPDHGFYVSHTINARIQVMYNTKLVRGDEVPKSWDEMLSPKWNSRSIMAANAEELPARLAWLWRQGDKMNWDRSFAFFKKLAEQKPLLVSGYGAAAQRVVAGEAAIFWFPTLGSPIVSFLKGAPLGFVSWAKFPAQLRASAMPKGARSHGAAWLFIDYLTSPEGQFEYTDVIQANFPVHKRAASGKLLQAAMKWGVSLDKADTISPSRTSDVITDEVLNTSQKFYFQVFGLR
jgi:iron(III) transport system substrate-binding protein